MLVYSRRDLSKIEKNREPVFLTKNGYGSMVVMSLEQYSALTDGVELALDEADRAAADTERRYSAEEVFERVRSRNSIRQKITAT